MNVCVSGSEPSGAFPEVFHRPVGVAAYPEPAERPLQQEDCEADYYAGCYAEVGVQPQPPVVEKE